MTATADGVIVVLVLIESDWNLKYKDTASAFPTGKSINRIRLEFKGVQKSMKTRQVEVLIESDWNLKDISPDSSPRLHGVLIESYWNLKLSILQKALNLIPVLIESDWNLRII